MQVARSMAELEDYRAGLSGSVGFVPTMGALHAGHLSLVDLAKAQSDQVVVSVFVNPAQFAPGEDFEAYPRDTIRDVSLLEAAGVGLVYVPQEADIYPDGQDSAIKAGAAAQGLESDFRPHFFDGVVNVVHRLFAQVRPDIAVFGEKDYQQLMVIREMVEAQGMGIEILGGETMRDEHGLALSSRNAYLSAEELVVARRLNHILNDSSLRAMRSNLDTGLPRRPNGLLAMTDALLDAGFNRVDYIETRWERVLAAAWIGKTRLIDNVEVF